MAETQPGSLAPHHSPRSAQTPKVCSFEGGLEARVERDAKLERLLSRGPLGTFKLPGNARGGCLLAREYFKFTEVAARPLAAL